jgi:hypothetical protein
MVRRSPVRYSGVMKVFVSSPVRGLESFRDAVARAGKILGHEVKRSEDFGASPDTPQQACLAGVRWAEVVVLLLGERYGEVQSSGLSATHEEYREARARGQVLAFIRAGVRPETQQQAFIDEVQAWASGVLTSHFSTPDELEEEVTRELHRIELARQAAPLDETELAGRAGVLIPDRLGFQEASLVLAIAGGPTQQVIRPAQLDDEELRRDLHRELLLGEHATFDTTHGVDVRVESNTLLLGQDRASFAVDSSGSICVLLPTVDRERSGLPVIIEEDLRDRLSDAFALVAWALDRIDPVMRLSHVAPAVAILSGAYLGWRTREEHAASPNTVAMPMNVGDRLVVTLTPPVCPRPALRYSVGELTEDFVTLLRRAYVNR